jgi:hypothetical protein
MDEFKQLELLVSLMQEREPDDTVHGKDGENLSEEERMFLARLARGELRVEEQQAAFDFLKGSPAGLRFLADLLSAPPDGTKPHSQKL